MSDMQKNQRPFLTTGQIVEIIGVHPNTIAVWRSTKKIVPRDRIAVAFLYDRKEVTDFLVERIKKGRLVKLSTVPTTDPVVVEVRNEISKRLSQ